MAGALYSPPHWNADMTDPAIRRPTVLQSAPELGPLVRARRKSQSLRIDDAASLLGVSVDLMSRLENGQGTVRLDKALAVLDGLGLTLMVLPKEHPWVREAASGGSPAGVGAAAAQRQE
ncbi:MAG: hypothetical protein RLY78_3096 [Pseudomonadota bacterium]